MDEGPTDATARLRACGTCGLVQAVPELAKSQRARCPRCRSIVARPKLADASSWTTGLALAALVLYPLAVGLPFMSVSRLGHHSAASILQSGVDLITHGELLVGGVVFVCSVILPLAKLAGLLAISTSRGWMLKKHAAFTWRAIELAGRWGMIDVLLAAVLLAMLKLGDVVAVAPGPGLFAFTSCVLLSLAASATFDPHALWETE
jgi:paraquat-inducible protein A